MHILCPTDFSESAQRAADVAAVLAARMKMPLKLQHSAPDAVVSVEMPVITQIEERAKAALEAEAARLRSHGAEVETDLHFGRAVDDVVQGAHRENTRMVVLGSAGRGLAGRWLTGNVAERVAEAVPVPTLVVRQPAPLLKWLQEGGSLKVLCGVDFSITADAALLAIKSLTKLAPCEVDAAFVEWPHDWPWQAGEGAGPEGDAEWKETMESHQRDLWERVSSLLEGVPVRAHVRGTGGRLDYEFVRLAEEMGSGLLVVGARQWHGLQRLRGPSFSRGVLGQASRNVLCVPLASYTPEFSVSPIRSVLVATDFSANGNGALRVAYGVLENGGSIHLFHVASLGKGDATILEKGGAHAAAEEARLQALIPKELASRRVKVDVKAVNRRDVAAAICEEADRRRVDLICMGTRGHSGVVSAVLGSVAQAVLAHSRIPVLAVPALER